VVSATLGSSRIAWCHVRQEDTGFRQSRVRNLGARVSSAPLLIFIDHDTVAHPEFVADHLRLAASGLFVQGKRCFLPPAETERLLMSGLEGKWWPGFWMRGLGNRKNAVHLPKLGRWMSSPKSWETSIRGCNLAVRRDDFVAVDGFDELYDGVWGREDSDLAYRLFHRGVRCRNASFAALQAHLHHPQVKRKGRDRLDDELDRMVAERRVKAIQGLSRMDTEGRILASSPGFAGKLG
jgi:GT2 family glycosyltransferase